MVSNKKGNLCIRRYTYSNQYNQVIQVCSMPAPSGDIPLQMTLEAGSKGWKVQCLPGDQMMYSI